MEANPSNQLPAGRGSTLHVLIVKDDKSAAASLAAMLKTQDNYRVVGVADDLGSALAIARSANVHIAFVDVNLGGLESGYQIAGELHHLGISCVFVTSTTPPFPIPELAAAWLERPYTIEAVSQSLSLATAELLAQVHSAVEAKGSAYLG